MIAANKLPKGCENRPPQSLAGIGLIITLRQSRYTNLRVPGTKKMEGIHQDTFTIFITITIAVMMMANRTTTIPRRNQRNAGGFFFSAGLSSTTTCE